MFASRIEHSQFRRRSRRSVSDPERWQQQPPCSLTSLDLRLKFTLATPDSTRTARRESTFEPDPLLLDLNVKLRRLRGNPNFLSFGRLPMLLPLRIQVVDGVSIFGLCHTSVQKIDGKGSFEELEG